MAGLRATKATVAPETGPVAAIPSPPTFISTRPLYMEARREQLARSIHRPLYSINSSARSSRACGTVNPRAFAVRMLIESSKRVGRCTGNSLGRDSLQDAPGILPENLGVLSQAWPVCHQPASMNERGCLVYCRKRISRSQRDDLVSLRGEERIGGDQQCLRLSRGDLGESLLDRGRGAGL